MKIKRSESKKIYFFVSRKGRRLRKFSGEEITEREIIEYEIPHHLIQKEGEEEETEIPRRLTWDKDNLPE